jgi:hypothetical protein
VAWRVAIPRRRTADQCSRLTLREASRPPIRLTRCILQFMLDTIDDKDDKFSHLFNALIVYEF